jgi:hypothetical protein
MSIIKWFLWRRWQFLQFSSAHSSPLLLQNCWKVNLGKCQEHRVIWRDMQKIINKLAEVSMRTITKEQAQAVFDLKAGYTLGHTDVATLQGLAEIALASLEAEPVAINDNMAYAFHHALSDSSLGADEVEEIKTGLRAAFANVTAPPAQVVPADISGIIERFQHQADHLSDWHYIDEHSCKVNRRDLLSAIEFMNACRAAMQGKAESSESLSGIQASPALDSLSNNAESLSSNSPVIPDGFCVAAKTSIPVISDGWVACSERMPERKANASAELDMSDADCFPVTRLHEIIYGGELKWPEAKLLARFMLDVKQRCS